MGRHAGMLVVLLRRSKKRRPPRVRSLKRLAKRTRKRCVAFTLNAAPLDRELIRVGWLYDCRPLNPKTGLGVQGTRKSERSVVFWCGEQDARVASSDVLNKLLCPGSRSEY